MEYNNPKNYDSSVKLNNLQLFNFIRKKIGIKSSELIENIYNKIKFLHNEYKNKNRNILFSKFKKIFGYFSKTNFNFLLQILENNYKISNKSCYLIEKLLNTNIKPGYLFLDEGETLMKANQYINLKNLLKKKDVLGINLKKESIVNGIVMIENLDPKSIIYEVVQKIYKILLDYDDIKLESNLVAILGFNNIKLVHFIIRNKNILINCLLLKKEIRNIDKNRIEQLILKKKSVLNFLKKSDLTVLSSAFKSLPCYPYHIENAFTQTKNRSINACRLPPGSYKLITPLFDEINISFKVSQRHKEIKEFVNLNNVPDFFRKALKPMINLNYIQSRIYPIITNSSSNILVCAPTGSGKTLVAFLCSLKILSQMKNLVIEGTIVYSPNIFYLAPMKALIKEITKKMKNIFDCFKVQIIDVTTDSKITKREFKNKFGIVTTPEKLDIISRKPYNVNIIKFVKLIIFDEIHLLNSERGVSIESLIARMYYFCEIYKKKIRLLGLSATFPNYVDLVKLLHIENKKGLFYFDENFRPCSIDYHILGLKYNKFMNTDEIMYEILKENLISYLNNNNQAIIFVHSRKDTFLTGDLIKEILKIDKSEYSPVEKNGFDETLSEMENLIETRSIKSLLKKKIGIHNAGINKKLREIMEDMFKEGIIKVLVSTATLAWGVNLPAKAVIIKGTKIYSPKTNGWIEINLLDLIQMFGRAGRPQYDKKGIGLLITSIENIRYYTSFFNNSVKIESFFHKYIISFLNAEIANGIICNLAMSINWLFLTYYSIRLREKVHSWILTDSYTTMQKEFLRLVKKVVYKSLGKLKNINFINYERENLCSNETGRVSSFNAVNYITIEYVSRNCKSILTDINFLKLLAKSVEFKNINVRIEELFELNVLFDSIPIPVNYNISLSYIKTIILIENYISKIGTTGTVLQCDSLFIIQNAIRITKAILQISLNKLNLSSFKISLKFFKMINNQLWNVLIPYRQIKLIPEYFFSKIRTNKIVFNKLFFKIFSKKDLECIIDNNQVTFKDMFMHFPLLNVKSTCNPVSNNLIVICLNITPKFIWNPMVHSIYEFFWLIISDSDNSKIIYYDLFSIKASNIESLIFFNVLLPVKVSKSAFFFIEIISDKWLRSESNISIPIKGLVFPLNLKRKLNYMSPNIYFKQFEKIIYFSKFKKVFNFYQKSDTMFLKRFSHTKNDIYIVVPHGYNKKAILNSILLIQTQDTVIRENKYRIQYIHSYKRKDAINLYSYKNDFYYSCIHQPKDGIIIRSLTERETILNFNNFSITNLIDSNPLLNINKFKKICDENLLLIIDELLFEELDERSEIEFLITKIKILNVKKKYNIQSIYFNFLYVNCSDLFDWLSVEKEFVMYLYEKDKNKMKLRYFENYLINSNNKELIYLSYCLINISNKLNNLCIIIFPAIIDVYEFIENLNIYFEYFKNNSNKYFLYKTQISRFLKSLYHKGVGLFLKIKGPRLKELSISMVIGTYISTLISSIFHVTTIPVKFINILLIYDYKKKQHNLFNNDTNRLFLSLNKFCSKWKNKYQIYIFVNKNCKKISQNYDQSLFLSSSLSNDLEKYFSNLFLVTKDRKKDFFRSFLTWTLLEKTIKQNPNYYGLENASIKKVNFYYSKLIENFFINLNKLKILNTSKYINKTNINIFLLVNKYNVHQKTLFQLKQKLFIIKNYKSILKTLKFLLDNDKNKKFIYYISNFFISYGEVNRKFIKTSNNRKVFSINLLKILVKYIQREIILEEIKDYFNILLKKCYLYLNLLLDLSIFKGSGCTTFLFLEFIQVFNQVKKNIFQALPNKKLINFQIPFFNILRSRISDNLKLNKIDDFHFININKVKKKLQISLFELEAFDCYVEAKYSISIYYIYKKKLDLINTKMIKNYIFSILTENLNSNEYKHLRFIEQQYIEKNTWVIITNNNNDMLILSKKLNLDYNNKFKILILKNVFYFLITIINTYYLGYEVIII